MWGSCPQRSNCYITQRNNSFVWFAWLACLLRIPRGTKDPKGNHGSQGQLLFWGGDATPHRSTKLFHAIYIYIWAYMPSGSWTFRVVGLPVSIRCFVSKGIGFSSCDQPYICLLSKNIFAPFQLLQPI